MQAEAVKRYAVEIDDDGHVVGEKNNDPGTEITRLANEYCDAHPGITFEDSLRRLQQRRPELFVAHNVYKFQPRNSSVRNHSASTGNPSREIAQRVSELQARDPKLGYEEATKAVLKADPQLAGAYANYVTQARR